ncbi:hypothetical protein AAG906_021554 [Vitis piasezkii]
MDPNDVCYMACLHKENVRAHLSSIPFDYYVCPYTFSFVDYFVRGLKLHVGDGTPSESAFVIIPPPSLDRGNLFSLCFPKKTTNYRIIIKLADMIDEVIPHDEPLSLLELFRVSVIEIAEQIAQYDLHGDSFTLNSDPIDERTLYSIEDVEIIDFNTTNKPRLNHPYQPMRETTSSIYSYHIWISLHGRVRICQALILIYFSIIYLSCHILGQLNRS